MRKLLLILFIFLSGLAIAGTPAKIIRVSATTEEIGENTAAGNFIVDTWTGKSYLVLTALLSTKTIATCTTSEIRENTNIDINLWLAGNTLSLTGDATTVDISKATAVIMNTAKVSNAIHSGDLEGGTSTVVKGINNVLMSSLGTGILKNTTGSGVPSIAVSGTDVKTINSTSILGSGDIAISGSKWTTDGLYGISYANNIGLGVTPTSGAKLYSFINLSGGLAGRFMNQSSSGNGVDVIAGSLDANNSFRVLDYLSTLNFKVSGNGNLYAPRLTNATTANVLYFDSSTGKITYGAGGTGGTGMVDPMTTRGDIIYRNASNITARLGLGATGTFLQSNGTDLIWGTAPAGSSQWTTDTYGITYGSNVGIGVASAANAALYVYKNMGTGWGGYIGNSGTGIGLAVQSANTSTGSLFYTLNGSALKTFDALGNGSIMMPYLASDATSTDVVYWNTTTGLLTHGAKPAGSGSNGTVTSVSSGSLSGLFTTSVAFDSTTPAISYTLANNILQNKVFASPYAATGAPSFRILDTNDLPNTTVTPGSYTATNLTVDAKGRITAASSGSSGSGMVYPAAGIALSTGTAWNPVSVPNNSVQWNSAYTNMGKVNTYYGSGNYKVLTSSDFTEDAYYYSITKTATPTSGSSTPFTSGGAFTQLALKQPTLVSGLNIKTFSDSSLVGSGNIPLKTVNGRYLVGTGDINDVVDKTANISDTIHITTESSIRKSTNTNITITFADIPTYRGQTGNIEITYYAAAVITFDAPGLTNVYIASNIYNTTVDANTRTILSKSSGPATYSYWIVGNNMYIHGTQNYN